VHVFFSSTTDGVDASSVPSALGTSGAWSAYLDESKGLIYYFNPSTGESKWEPPEGTDFSGVQKQIGAAKKVEMRERLKTYLEERLNDSATDFIGGMQDERRDMEWKRKEAGENVRKFKKSELMESSSSSPAKKKMVQSETKKVTRDILQEWREWQALIDDKRGQIYYYNKNTRTSSWERPVGFPDFKLSASKRIALEDQKKRYLEWHKDAAKVKVLGKGTVVVSDSKFDNESEPEPVEEAEANLPKVTQESKGREDKAVVNSPPTLPIVQQGEWSAYFDVKTGVVFYFNEQTGETSWDPPFKDFPTVVMEGTTPKVLDPGSGNISMERAIGLIGVDEMEAALAWEEAKKKERARKAAMRAKKEAEKDTAKVEPVEMYELAKKAELERLEEERKLAHDKTVREEAAAKHAEEEKKRVESERLKQERIVAEEKAAKERAAAIKLAMQAKMEQQKLEKERLEMERLAKARLEAEEKKLEQERLVAEAVAAKEREAAAKLAIQQKLEQERLEKDRLERERLEKERLEAEEERRGVQAGQQKQPVLPKEEPKITVESVETMVAPLKTRTHYDILQCSSTASRTELKRAYLSLAKETHPDALFQYGIENTAETERRFGEVSRAWKVLGDPTSRRRYDRQLQAKGISTKAGSMFENWVMGAAKAMDEALAKAEDNLEDGSGKKP